MIKLSTIKPNKKNPRKFTEVQVAQMVKSIDEFPAMMSLRPMVVDADNVVLGGNMRLRALHELGFKEIPDEWVKRADELTEDEKRRFIIADNLSFGEWDWDILANEWEEADLTEWGMDVPENWGSLDVDYSGKNKEVDVNEFGTDMTITLKYSEDEYWQVKEQLSKIAQSPEAAVWKLLGNET